IGFHHFQAIGQTSLRRARSSNFDTDEQLGHSSAQKSASGRDTLQKAKASFATERRHPFDHVNTSTELLAEYIAGQIKRKVSAKFPCYHPFYRGCRRGNPMSKGNFSQRVLARQIPWIPFSRILLCSLRSQTRATPKRFGKGFVN